MAGVGAAVSTEEDGDQLCDLVQGERLGKRRGRKGGRKVGGREGSGEGRQDEEGERLRVQLVFLLCQPPPLFLPVLMISLWRS